MDDLTIREDLKKDANNAVVEAKSMSVINNHTNEQATNFIKALKNLQKEIKSELRPAIEKAHELHRHLTSQEKRLLAPLQDAEQLVKSKVSKFLFDQEKIRKEAQQKEVEMADAHEERTGEFVPAPIVESKVNKQEGVSTKVNWKFEVTMPHLIPREYLTPDDKLIGGYVRAMKDKACIPGVRILSENTVSVRA